MPYETIIGLEVHAELATKSKIYCSCTTEFGGEVNTHTCPICAGFPGTLPVLNKQVVEYAIKAGLAIDCAITPHGKQDRKNYFYPDLPKAYQVSQFDLPVCVGGHLDITVDDEERRIGITRIHIEEDAGKLLHDVSGDTLVDYNRCGVPLIEIVTEPDMRSAEEARVFLEMLKSILEYTEVSDCKMQEGSLRCDVNVSVRPVGQAELGTRTEMKNVNSFRAAYRAIQYESARQIEVLEGEGTIRQETRRWDDDKGITYPMRSKEEAHDYRYFPEPDLAPIEIDPAWVERVRATLPELPHVKKARYVEKCGLTDYEAGQISASKAMAAFFDATVKAGAQSKTVANWLLGDISRILNEQSVEAIAIPFKPEHLAELIAIIEEGVISNSAGKKVIEELFENPHEPRKIVEEKGLAQISDKSALVEAVREVLKTNPQSVADFKAGKDKAIGFLVGQAMRATKGKGNPQLLNEILREELNKEA